MAEQQSNLNSTSGISRTSEKRPPKRENVFLNLGCNLLFPIFLLNKGERWFGGLLEPYFENVAAGVLLIAVAFPLGYFIYDFIRRSKFNLISIIGLIGVLLTGAFGIFKLPTEWFAIKEAAIPLVLGIGVVLSLFTSNPFIKALVYNPDVCDVEKVETALKSRNNERKFEKLLRRCTWLIAGSFLISVILNFALARWIVVSPTGSEAFNAEVSKMMGWSWVVISVPSMILMMFAFWILIDGIHKMTGLKLEEVLHGVAEQDKTQ